MTGVSSYAYGGLWGGRSVHIVARIAVQCRDFFARLVSRAVEFDVHCVDVLDLHVAVRRGGCDHRSFHQEDPCRLTNDNECLYSLPLVDRLDAVAD
jgi:hypothetical protein